MIEEKGKTIKDKELWNLNTTILATLELSITLGFFPQAHQTLLPIPQCDLAKLAYSLFFDT